MPCSQPAVFVCRQYIHKPLAGALGVVASAGAIIPKPTRPGRERACRVVVRESKDEVSIMVYYLSQSRQRAFICVQIRGHKRRSIPYAYA